MVEFRADPGVMLVGDTGFEPVTSSVSGKRATAAPIALVVPPRWRRDLNPCRRICSPLPRLSATPPGWVCRDPLRADDGIRTRDPHLGKVMLYQLSHVRMLRWQAAARMKRLADSDERSNSG